MELFIARDKDNSLSLCAHKPVCEELFGSWEELHRCYDDDYAFQAYIPENLFPEVTFENSPMRVELKLVQNDK